MTNGFTDTYTDDIDLPSDYVCSNQTRQAVTPPEGTNAAIVWARLDSGSGPMIADCGRFFPQHKVRPSKAQQTCTRYAPTSGGELANAGEIQKCQFAWGDGRFDLAIRNAKVARQILSAKYLTNKDVRVLFRNGGGVVAYTMDGGYLSWSGTGCSVLLWMSWPPDDAAYNHRNTLDRATGLKQGFAKQETQN